MIMLILTYLERSLLEIPLPFNLSFVQIILPSILLNLLLAIPIHSMIRDLADRLYPAKVVS